MKKSAVDCYNNLPNELKNSDMPEWLERDNEGFERLCKGFGMLSKVEVEVEYEEEIEYKEEDIEKIYKIYPAKCPIQNRSTGKTPKDKAKIKTLLKTKTPEELKKAIELYIQDCTSNKVYIKNFATFLNNLPDLTEVEKQGLEKLYYDPYGKELSPGGKFANLKRHRATITDPKELKKVELLMIQFGSMTNEYATREEVEILIQKYNESISI